MDSKQFERGVAEYRKAFELDPSFFEHASQNGVSAHMGSPQDRAQFSFVMARLFAGNGDLDRALHFLRSAIEDGYPAIDEVYRDKEFTRVRNDERFHGADERASGGVTVKCSRYSAGTGEEPSRIGWPARRLRSSR